MSHEEGSSLNMFKFDEGLKVTVNTNSITMVEAEEAATHILREIYVLELENQPNAWIVHKISGETFNFGHYELEGTPKEGHILEKFIGFLTIRMPYISNIKQRPYMKKFGFRDDIQLKRGWRLSFEEFDYNINPNGPSRNGVGTGLQFNPYLCTEIV
jgi:hypothetical protein